MKKMVGYLAAILISSLFFTGARVEAVSVPVLGITSYNYSEGAIMDKIEKNSVAINESVQLYAVITGGNDLPENPEDAGWYVLEKDLENVTWESDNPSIASVNNGLVVGKSQGKVKIKANYENENATFEVTVDRKEYGHVIFIGDSVCRGWNIEENKAVPELSWVAKTVDALDLRNYSISCQGGSGISVEKEVANGEKIKYIDLLNNANKQIVDKNEVSWVIINGGYNDKANVNNKELIMSEGDALIAKAKEYFPNAQIAIGMYGWHKTNETIKNQMRTMENYYRELASNNNVLYIDGIEESLRDEDGLFTNDDVHPNENGQQNIANYMEEFLKENTMNIIYHDYHNKEEKTTRNEIYLVGKENNIAPGYIFDNDNVEERRKLFGWFTSQYLVDINTDKPIYSDYSANEIIDDEFIKEFSVLNLYSLWVPVSSNGPKIYNNNNNNNNNNDSIKDENKIKNPDTNTGKLYIITSVLLIISAITISLIRVYKKKKYLKLLN